MIKKLLKKVLFIMMISLSFPLFLGSSQVYGQSGSNEVKVILHKLLFEDGNLPPIATNNGIDNPFLKPELQNYQGLNGVTFDIYDVTDEYYSLLSQGENQEEIQATLQKSKQGNKVESIVTDSVDVETGVAVSYLKKKDDKKRDKVYRFNEVKAPVEEVKTLGSPLILILPLKDDEGNDLDTIHLYPKNEATTPETPKTPDVEKVIDKKQTSYQLGDTLHFKITTTIPKDIADLTRYELKDHADKNLWLKEGSLRVTLAGKDILSDAQVITENHDFSLVFDPSHLRNYAEQSSP